jgi:hypothetical protein
LQVIRRFRVPALFCAFAVMICELVSRPYMAMGICDDGPYIMVARNVATTGHIAFNGWSAAMLGWQLYFGAAFIRLFGFSFTTVRMTTMMVAVTLAFFLQRTLVRSGSTERNATIGTLGLVLSPLYLMLSATFMTDIHGLFAIVLCLYGCLRALQATTSRAAIGWLWFAVATNAVCGTSRQIAWLGVLVMVPSMLWLLRARRRVLMGGVIATFAGVLFILGCLLWLKHQPYTLPEHVIIGRFPVIPTIVDLTHFFLDIPFLLLPMMALFLPQIRKSRLRVLTLMTAVAFCYTLLVLRQGHLHQGSLLEPTTGDWVTIYGGYGRVIGGQPVFLHRAVRLLLTVVSLGGLLGVFASLSRSNDATRPVREAPNEPTWKDLAVLLGPFTIGYTLLLISRAVAMASIAGPGVLDRYALGLLVIALVCLVRLYQERVQLQIPFAGVVLVALMAFYGVVLTHNTFAFYRARVTMAAELRAAGVPDISTDNGWEYNMLVELKYANHINAPEIELPANAYVPVPPLPLGTCPMFYYNYVPHIKPIYGVSYDPNECFGPAPFAPVNYSRWLTQSPGTLYVVRYTAASKQ